MYDPEGNETRGGLAYFKRVLETAGVRIVEQRTDGFRNRTTYFAIGNAEQQTDIVLSDELLDDLSSTKDYHPKFDSYAVAVGGRLKCGSPELFYCLSRIAVRVSIRWPIQSAAFDGKVSSFVLMGVINQIDGQIACCSMELGFMPTQTVFDTVPQTVNSVRTAIDAGLLRFYSPGEHQEVYQRIERQPQPQERRTEPEIKQFLAGKAYVLGFLATNETSHIWAADPWDAMYLGVTKKELALAMRMLQAEGLLKPGTNSEYPFPTDKLLLEKSSKKDTTETFIQSAKELSRSNLPKKEELLKDMGIVLERHLVSALLVIDLDHFKTVNDTKGHTEGDACLDRVIQAVGAVVGRKGRVYRWGGDEFAVLLPDFSTEEAKVTAERIRSAVEKGKVGGDISVTTSIGVCGSDHAHSKSAEEILEIADKAMYQSKNSGKDRASAWSPESLVAKTESQTSFEEERRKQIFSLISQLEPSRQAVLKLLSLRSSMTEMMALQTVQQSGLKPGYGVLNNLQRSTNLVRPVPGQPPTTRPTMNQLWEVTPENVVLVRQYFVEHPETS